MHTAQTDDSGNHITHHTVFPGITMRYSDIHSHMAMDEQQYAGRDVLVINYCSKGRIEWELADDRFHHLCAGDLSIHMLDARRHAASFPLDHYHGISLLLDIDEIKTIGPMMQHFGVDLRSIYEKFHRGDAFFVLHNDSLFRHIFGELRNIPPVIHGTYAKIKVLELLLLLSTIELEHCVSERSYLRKRDVQRMREVKQYLQDQIAEPITLADLSSRFDIPLTQLKTNFKTVYGMPVYGFLRALRMQTAAQHLRTANASVADVAGRVGYANASKFAKAFKDEMGYSPLQYRKNP